MKYLFLFLIVLFVSCTKETAQSIEEPLKPVMIQVQAEHEDGEIVTTPIVLVR